MRTNYRKSLLALVLLAGIGLASCNKTSASVKPDSKDSLVSTTNKSETPVESTLEIKEGTYTIYGYEWGPGVTKVVLKLQGKIEGITKDSFKLFAGSDKIADADMVEATLTDAYTSDALGTKTNSASEYVAFEITPEHNKCSPFDSDPMTLANSWAVYKAKIVLNTDLTIGGNKVVSGTSAVYKFKDSERKTPEFDSWERGSYTKGDQTLTTIAYTPAGAKDDSTKNPMIIWLHGAGGGGTDPVISALDSQVVNFTKDKIQSHFTTDTQKGAYVLSVQTPTYWCNDGKGGYNSALNAGDAFGKGQPGMYTETLFETIKDFVKNHPDVDEKRLYIGGCSNGGYMTMEMMINHGDYFAAYYPICEGYRNYFIGDDKISEMKDRNIYFIQAEGDELFPPMEFTVPTYYRLINAGAENVHFSFFDSSCLYAKGYIQHYSWVYVCNDEVKYDFDKDAVKADYANLDFSDYGALTGQDTYVSNANNTVEIDGGLFGWMSRQSLA